MAKKDQRFTVSLDEESAELLQRIAEELTEGNRSQGARRAIQTAARMLLDPPQTGADGLKSRGYRAALAH